MVVSGNSVFFFGSAVSSSLMQFSLPTGSALVAAAVVT